MEKETIIKLLENLKEAQSSCVEVIFRWCSKWNKMEVINETS